MLRTLTHPLKREKRIRYTRLAIGAALFALILLLPTPRSMVQVGARVELGPRLAHDHLARELYATPFEEATAWQVTTVEMLTAAARSAILDKEAILKRTPREWRHLDVAISPELLPRVRRELERLEEPRLRGLLEEARTFVSGSFDLERLDDEQLEQARKAARKIRLGIALVIFVVFCFITEAMPFPAVAFTIGLIVVFGGLVDPRNVAALFWSDATWFIMGSLMLAAALVRTGLDKRISLSIFSLTRTHSVKGITAMLILVISPTAAFLSGHVLAAIFLPIGLILYNNSLSKQTPSDPELAKMLLLTIALACNIGGFGAPSGGARNIIIMNYLEDLYGVTIGFGEWLLYGMPFVLLMMGVSWVLVNVAFKPTITSLKPALETLRRDIRNMGPWTRRQLFVLAVFLLVIAGWITEKTLLHDLLGFSPGLGVIAVTGAMVYLISGVVSWRDYQTEVDWGVVWLYAGAIIFGRVVDQTGTAAWMAGTLVEGLKAVGMAGGTSLVLSGSLITALMTNLLAAGPTAAAVGPITIEMAAVSDPGSILVPIMGLATACASAFAYLLVIGTPPNAIVYSSGHLSPRDFIRVGVGAMVGSFLVLILLSSVWWPLLMAP